MDACGLAATEINIVSVRTPSGKVESKRLHPKQILFRCALKQWGPAAQTSERAASSARSTGGRRGALLRGHTACFVTQQTPASPAYSAARATRWSTAPAVSSLLLSLMLYAATMHAHLGLDAQQAS